MQVLRGKERPGRHRREGAGVGRGLLALLCREVREAMGNVAPKSRPEGREGFGLGRGTGLTKTLESSVCLRNSEVAVRARTTVKEAG